MILVHFCSNCQEEGPILRFERRAAPMICESHMFWRLEGRGDGGILVSFLFFLFFFSVLCSSAFRPQSIESHGKQFEVLRKPQL
jgi:hypothetical protein